MNSLRKESIYLYAIQITNLAIPLLTLPYFTKVLGLAGLGKLGVAQTIFFFMGFVIDFGFTYSASRYISLDKSDKKKIDRTYTNVQLLRLFIYLFTSLVIISIILALNLSHQEKSTYIVAVVSSFSFLLIPNWLFNGLGINSALALMTLLFRALTLIPIFLLVNDSEDYVIAFLIQNSSLIILGIFVSLYIKIKKKVKIDISHLDLNYMKEILKDGFDAFSGSALSVVYTTGIPILVKMTLGDVYVGVYILVERILSILKQLFMPIIQAYYATICILYDRKKISEIKSIMKKITIFYVMITSLALIVNLFIGRWVIEIFFDNQQIVYPYIFISIIGQFVVGLSIITIYGNILPSGNGYVLKKLYAQAAFIFLVIVLVLQNYLTLGIVYFIVIFIELLIVIEAQFYIKKMLR